jgi:surfeit locus 1 family protein
MAHGSTRDRWAVRSRWQFRPRLAITAAAIVFIAITVSLGNWQIRRAEEKEAAQARFDELASEAPVNLSNALVAPETLTYRRASVRGEYVDRYTILLDNKVYRGRVGYHVVSPLRIAGGDVCVLVDRGWVAAGATRAELPHVGAPSGEQRVEGIAVAPSSRYFELAPEVLQGPVWENLVLERYRAWSGLVLQPVVIQQTNDAHDGLIREWGRPDTGVDRHRGYALQWFSFAILAFVLYIALNLKRRANDV